MKRHVKSGLPTTSAIAQREDRRHFVETTPGKRGKKPPATRTAPLSFAQQRLWFLDQYEPDNILYNIPAAIRLNGALNVKALEQSLNEIVKRHEALRTTFAVVERPPVQVINEPRDFRLTVIELRENLSEKKEATVARLAAEEARRPSTWPKARYYASSCCASRQTITCC